MLLFTITSLICGKGFPIILTGQLVHVYKIQPAKFVEKPRHNRNVNKFPCQITSDVNNIFEMAVSMFFLHSVSVGTHLMCNLFSDLTYIHMVNDSQLVELSSRPWVVKNQGVRQGA
jgi:accessory gene regulator protein AgrB